MTKQEAFNAAEAVRGFTWDRLRVAVIASHSALDLCDGATDEGLRTLAVCQRGRERTYLYYSRIVHETLILPRFRDVLGEDVIEKLRSRSALFVPNRSLTAYVPVNDVESRFPIPMFGNRHILRADGRHEQLELFQKAGISAPKRIDSPEKIDGPVVVKVQDARNPVERAFFTCVSPAEFHRKAEQRIARGILSAEDVKRPWIEEFVLGAPFNFNFFFSPLHDRLEFLGLDRRIQTNIDGLLKLPAEDQLALGDDIKGEIKNEEVGHESVTIRESLLDPVLEMGENLVEASRTMFPPGIIGPFALQGAVKPNKKIVIFDFSPRMPGSPVLYSSPYSKYLFGQTVTSGRRVAIEIKEAARQKRLPEIVT